MMIVPTYVGPSQIEGVGIFAAAPIKSGDAIWALEEKFDLLFPVNELAGLPDLQRQFLERYGYPHMTRPDMFVLEFDNGRFMNHCEQPNTDIAAGEELTCNYAEFDPTFEMLPGRTFLNASVVQEMRGMAAAE